MNENEWRKKSSAAAAKMEMGEWVSARQTEWKQERLKCVWKRWNVN